MLYQAPYEAFYISYIIQNFQPLLTGRQYYKSSTPSIL